MSVCAPATTLPPTMEMAETPQNIATQWGFMTGRATRKTLRSAAKLAAFGPTDMKAVMDVGAPSYASGAHIWKGTAAILNANPDMRRMTEAIISGLE